MIWSSTSLHVFGCWASRSIYRHLVRVAFPYAGCGMLRATRSWRWLAVLVLATILVGACAGGEQSDPFDLSDEGIACMRARGWDASALIFIGDDRGMGFSTRGGNNPSDLSALVWPIDAGAGDLSDALDACLEELTAIAPPAYPAEVSIGAAEEGAIRRCVEAVPNAQAISDIRITRYEDGSHSIEHIQNHEGLTATEIVALDRAISECLPEHP